MQLQVLLLALAVAAVSAKQASKAPSVPPPATASPTVATYLTSGGYVAEGTHCKNSVKVVVGGKTKTFVGCIPMTKVQPAMKAPGLVPPSGGVSNDTWCYTGTAGTYPKTGAGSTSWGYCYLLTAAPTAQPTMPMTDSPVVPVPTTQPTISLPPSPTEPVPTDVPTIASTDVPTISGVTGAPSIASTGQPTPNGYTYSPVTAAPTSATKSPSLTTFNNGSTNSSASTAYVSAAAFTLPLVGAMHAL